MPNILRNGAEWLAKQRTKHASEIVRVYASGFLPQEMPSTPGRSTREVQDANGLIVVYGTRDFVFQTADFKLFPIVGPGQSTAAIAVAPQQGMRIQIGTRHDSLNVDYHVYEVLSSDGEDSWRFADDFNLEIRVHTKYVGHGPPMPA